MATKSIPIDQLLMPRTLQMRADGENADHVQDLADALEKKGGRLPDPEVYHVEEEGREGLYVVDGRHTTLAHKKIGRVEVRCKVTKGTWNEAVLAAAAANNTPAHRALKRSRKDLRKAVLAALEVMPRKASAKTVAAHVGCSDQLVLNVKKELEDTTSANIGGSSEPKTVIDVKGRERKIPPKKEKKAAVGDWKATNLDTFIKASNAVWKKLTEACVFTVAEFLGAVEGGNNCGLKPTETASILGEIKELELANEKPAAPTPSANGHTRSGSEVGVNWRDFETHLGYVVRIVDTIPHYHPDMKEDAEYQTAFGHLSTFTAVMKRIQTRLTKKESV